MSILRIDNNTDMSDQQLISYFNRVQLPGNTKPERSTHFLQLLHALHTQHVPFENISSYTGNVPSLEPEAIYEKMVERKRGGYCYEHNKLLHIVLSKLGFEVWPLLARVRWSLPDALITPPLHMALLVKINSQLWLADVGFGVVTLPTAIRVELDVEQATTHGIYRITQKSSRREEFTLQFKAQDQWKDVYQFTISRAELVDCDVANWYTSTFVESIFVKNLVLCNITEDSRVVLFNNRLVVRKNSGIKIKTELYELDSLTETLRMAFGIELKENELVDISLKIGFQAQ